MTEDPRCCGSGTCIIDPTGRCWCGQKWDGEKMCFDALTSSIDASEAMPPETPEASAQTDPDANKDN